jgi:hypothetical protein
MRKNRSFFVLFVSLCICFNLFTYTAYADSTSSISIELDKTDAKVGETITASIKINNIENFSGYQVNLRYNAEVLEAVNAKTGEKFAEKTLPGDGDLLLNQEYTPIGIVDNDPPAGILNMARSYLSIEEYKKSGKPESTGTLAVIGFKVLKQAATEIIFEDLGTMPGSNQGTMLYRWDGKKVENESYKVIFSPKINPSFEPAPLPKYTMKSTASSSETSDKSDNRAMIIAIIAVIVIIIAVAAVFILRGNKGQNDQNEEEDWDDEDYDDEENEDTREDDTDAGEESEEKSQE